MGPRTRTPGALAVCGLAGGWLLLSSAPAWAEKGMPQLDFGNPLTIAQVVWLAIIFFALYLLLSNWALPKVASVLEMRAGAIAGDLDAARAAKAEADAAVAELTHATREAQARAQAEIAQAVATAKAAADKDAAVLNAKLDAQIREAEQRIAAARTAALGALEQVASDTAREVVSRLTGTAIAPANVNRAVAAVLAARAA
jgi:F-type H+-transporting ATPase subunit b